jgi:hypothetical protein
MQQEPEELPQGGGEAISWPPPLEAKTENFFCSLVEPH